MKNIELYEKNLGLLNDNDFCLLSYPRSGNTWLRICMADIYLQIHGYETDTELSQDFGLIIPTLNKHNIENVYPFIDGARVFKSHKWKDAYAKEHRIVYIYRNPLDVLRSYYRFYHKGGVGDLMGFIRKEAIRWEQHARNAIKHKSQNTDSICLLSFEELSSDGAKTLNRVFEFMSMDASPFVDKALFNHSFDKQKKNALDRGIPSARYNFGEGKVGLGSEMPEQVCEYIKENTWDTYVKLRDSFA